MKTLTTIVKIAVAGWAAAAAIGVVFAYAWRRERFGRGGPMPPQQAGMLLTPLRRFVHPVDNLLRTFRLEPGDVVLF